MSLHQNPTEQYPRKIALKRCRNRKHHGLRHHARPVSIYLPSFSTASLLPSPEALTAVPLVRCPISVIVAAAQRALQRDPQGDWTIGFFVPSGANDETLHRMSSYDFSYSAMFAPSYELESYDFNYSFELEDLYDFSYSYEVEFYGSYSFDERFFDSDGFSYSYSYGNTEDPEAEIEDVRSVTSLDVSIFFQRSAYLQYCGACSFMVVLLWQRGEGGCILVAILNFFFFFT